MPAPAGSRFQWPLATPCTAEDHIGGRCSKPSFDFRRLTTFRSAVSLALSAPPSPAVLSLSSSAAAGGSACGSSDMLGNSYSCV